MIDLNAWVCGKKCVFGWRGGEGVRTAGGQARADESVPKCFRGPAGEGAAVAVPEKARVRVFPLSRGLARLERVVRFDGSGRFSVPLWVGKGAFISRQSPRRGGDATAGAVDCDDWSSCGHDGGRAQPCLCRPPSLPPPSVYLSPAAAVEVAFEARGQAACTGVQWKLESSRVQRPEALPSVPLRLAAEDRDDLLPCVAWDMTIDAQPPRLEPVESSNLEAERFSSGERPSQQEKRAGGGLKKIKHEVRRDDGVSSGRARCRAIQICGRAVGRGQRGSIE